MFITVFRLENSNSYSDWTYWSAGLGEILIVFCSLISASKVGLGLLCHEYHRVEYLERVTVFAIPLSRYTLPAVGHSKWQQRANFNTALSHLISDLCSLTSITWPLISDICNLISISTALKVKTTPELRRLLLVSALENREALHHSSLCFPNAVRLELPIGRQGISQPPFRSILLPIQAHWDLHRK